MIELEYDQCNRCERRVWSHDPAYTEWEDIDGSSVCPDCVTPGEWAAFDEVVLETRCARCGSLVFAETIDGLADIPIVEEDAEVMCASCSSPDGRIAEMSERGDRS
jgi:DNA-directed RNA polymerase subunit RPC12/RpoP